MNNRRFFKWCLVSAWLATMFLPCISCGTDKVNNKVSKSEEQTDGYVDIYPDTWVATDDLGRTMPDITEVGPLKNDHKRIVGMFYITWHGKGLAKLKPPYEADVTKVLSASPEARLDAKHPAWKEGSYHWGEPEMGYFLSQDEYVIRKDMSMLADAGVDVLVMDVTNAVRYWDEWETLFTTMQKIKEEGNKVPKFCFWAFNGPVITVVQDLYDKVYKADKYTDLWFYWNDKPLLLYNSKPTFDANGGGVKNPNPHYDPKAVADASHPHYNDPYYTQEFYTDYTQEIKDFFTLRTMWWGYYEWAGERFVGTENNWSFGYDMHDEKVAALPPDSLVSCLNGVKEEFAVTPAQHPISVVGKSWTRENKEPKLNEHDLPEPTYVPWLGKTVENPSAYGIYFQERWNEALKCDPEFIYLNDWNEWTAGKYQSGKDPGGNLPGPTEFLNRKNPFYFVDQYNSEFNRAIQPMKDGYTDNYYMQMTQNIRHYKGIRPIPENVGLSEIKVDGSFNDWKDFATTYRDTKGDVAHRDHDGYGGTHYINTSGRNDFVGSKVAVDKDMIYFYVETADTITSYSDPNWMLLLIDADNNSSTGWFGYDYLINKQVIDEQTTMLMQYDSETRAWKSLSELVYRVKDNKMELAIPRSSLNLSGPSFVFDFKWSDNPAELNDPISLCVNGDTAPNRRFNYRCIWKQD